MKAILACCLCGGVVSVALAAVPAGAADASSGASGTIYEPDADPGARGGEGFAPAGTAAVTDGSLPSGAAAFGDGPQGFSPFGFGPDGAGSFGPPGPYSRSPFPGNPGGVRPSSGYAVTESGAGFARPVPFGPMMRIDANIGDGPGFDADFYGVGAFLPWHLDPGRSLFFASLTGSVTDRGDFLGNFGGGYRALAADNRIYGASGWYDIDEGHRRTYHRAGFSLESLGRYFDMRANAYFVLNRSPDVLFDGFVGTDPFFRGHLILLDRARISDNPYSGVDWEVGGLTPFLGRYGVYTYVGGYYLYARDDRNTLGFQFRADVAATDDFAVGVRYMWDDVFESSTFVTLSLTLPDGKPRRWFKPRPQVERLGSPVHRLPRVPVHRRTDLTEEPLIRVETGQPFFVHHVDPNQTAPGTGTFENPFGTLEAARQANRPRVDIIRVLPREDDTGTNLAVNNTFQLLDNQRLLSTTVQHTIFAQQGTFLLPGFTGGTGPLVTNLSQTPSAVIAMGNNSEVSGFRIDGSGIHNGVRAANVIGYDINRNQIFNGRNGVVVIADDGGTTSGVIADNTIGGNTDSGIRVDATNDSVVETFVLGNLIGAFEGLGANAGAGFLLRADSGLSLTTIEDNEFAGNQGTAVEFQLSGDALALINANNNFIGLAPPFAVPGDVLRPGFDSDTLGPFLDVSSDLEPLGFTIDFFGQVFDSLFVNSHGNVTFTAPTAQFTPPDLLTTQLAVIAPFWADVDPRVHGEPVTFGQGEVDGRAAFGVNWIDVDYFVGDPAHGDQLNRFQLVLIDRSDIAPGDFDIEFNYDQIRWETGDLSGGTGGLGGNSARVGFSNGIDTQFELPGSGIPGSFLDDGPAATSLVQNSLNSDILGRYVFQARDGQVFVEPPFVGVDGIRVVATDNAVVGPSNFNNNVIDSVGRNAMSFEGSGNATFNSIAIEGNTITGSGRHGLNLQTSLNAAILASDIRANTVTGSGGNAVNVDIAADATLQNRISTVIGGPLAADRNVFSDSAGSGIGASVGGRGLLEMDVVNNLISGNAESGIQMLGTGEGNISSLIQLNEIVGSTDGIFLDRRDRSFFDVTVGNAPGQTGLGNLIANHTTGLRVFATGDDNVVNVLRLGGNTFANNVDGVVVDLQADAIFLVLNALNVFDTHSGDGVRVTTTNNSAFGNPFTGTGSVFDGNTFVNTAGLAYNFTALEQSFQHARIIGEAGRGSITSDIVGSGGVAITNASSAGGFQPGRNTYVIQGLDIDLFTAGGDGINIASTGPVGSNITIGGALATQSVNIDRVGGDGININLTDATVALNQPSAAVNPVSIRNVTVTRSGNHGITISQTRGVGDVSILQTTSSFNQGRGLDVDVRTEDGEVRYEVGRRDGALIPDLAVGNVFNNNVLQGVVFQTVAQTNGAGTETFDPNNPPPVANDYQDVTNSNGTFDNVRARLDFVGNTVRFNGTAATPVDGMVLQVGTNTHLVADISANTFGGNQLDDLDIRPIVSVNPDQTSAGNEVALDPVAHLELLFGAHPITGQTRHKVEIQPDVFIDIDEGNIGNRFRVSTEGFADPILGSTVAGQFTNQDPFKPAPRSGFGIFHVYFENRLNGPLPGNQFTQAGVLQNVQQTFLDANQTINTFFDPTDTIELQPVGTPFPNPAFP